MYKKKKKEIKCIAPPERDVRTRKRVKRTPRSPENSNPHPLAELRDIALGQRRRASLFLHIHQIFISAVGCVLASLRRTNSTPDPRRKKPPCPRLPLQYPAAHAGIIHPLPSRARRLLLIFQMPARYATYGVLLLSLSLSHSRARVHAPPPPAEMQHRGGGGRG